VERIEQNVVLADVKPDRFALHAVLEAYTHFSRDSNDNARRMQVRARVVSCHPTDRLRMASALQAGRELTVMRRVPLPPDSCSHSPDEGLDVVHTDSLALMWVDRGLGNPTS
jgi:hypothetical protein